MKAAKTTTKKASSKANSQTTNKRTALLLDVTYKDNEKESVINLFVKEGKEYKWLADKEFRPYFHVLTAEKEKDKTIKELSSYTFGDSERFKALRIEETSFTPNTNTGTAQEKIALKIVFAKVAHVVQARKILSDMGYEKREHDLPFAQRYLIDKRLEPANGISFTGTDDNVNELVVVAREFDAKMASFDLETYMGKKFGIGLEPIVMASVAAEDEKKDKVFSHSTIKVKGLEVLKDEKEVIQALQSALQEYGVLVTYNGDNFDFPYLKERSKKNKIEFKINGTEPRIVRSGMDNAVKLNGIQHVDAFGVMQFLQRTGSVNTVKLDIESVSEKVFGVPKEKVYPKEINEAWGGSDAKKLARLVDYNLKDSQTALRIAKEFLPMFIEISKLTSQPLYDTTRNSTSNIVEDLLLKETHARKFLAPNKPKEGEIGQRLLNPIKGAFVKEPLAGLHEAITVLDFASLYPSIIITHNISPETLNCTHEDCKKKNTSPDGTWFCTKERGLFPEILDGLLKQRLALKKEYKRKKKEDGIDDKVMFAKQWALKIILNSVYGYLGYGRARWYSRECASAVTAWARGYIHETITKAEKAGFPVLYSDTDSIFMQFVGQKTKATVEEFVEKVNNELPGGMELELDGYYKRGIFVTKKEGGAAKKRYALIDEKGGLKIVGFEYVRRDWCMLARETQKSVIELVLKEGNPTAAIKLVRKVVSDLRAGAVAKSDLAIMTVLQRNPKDYTSIGPHVAAAMKAIEKGKDLDVGSMLSFIITKAKGGKESISDKAELDEYVEEGDYDADYYIENQVIPAVIKIIQELGCTKEDLLSGGKQTGLGAWS